MDNTVNTNPMPYIRETVAKTDISLLLGKMCIVSDNFCITINPSGAIKNPLICLHLISILLENWK